MAICAVNTFNSYRLIEGSYPLIVRLADDDKDKGVENSPSDNIYVGNLPLEASTYEVEQMFQGFGVVVSHILLSHLLTGRSKGVALIRYDTVEGARRAVRSMHGFLWHGRALDVKFAENREDKKRRQISVRSREDADKVPVAKGRLVDHFVGWLAPPPREEWGDECSRNEPHCNEPLVHQPYQPCCVGVGSDRL